jgi:hypothetical protein
MELSGFVFDHGIKRDKNTIQTSRAWIPMGHPSTYSDDPSHDFFYPKNDSDRFQRIALSTFCIPWIDDLEHL